jgi:hypothetical protein
MKLPIGGVKIAALAVLAAGVFVLTAGAATNPTKPSNSALPTISGTFAAGQTLTATSGTWSGTTPITYYYQWALSNSKGGFDPIPGATTSTYTLDSNDLGHSLFVQVKAQNAAGAAWADSKPTGVVANAAPGSALPIAAVSLPDRLVISGVSFSPLTTGTSGKTEIQARFQITDTNGHPVQGAMVYAAGVPFNWAQVSPETATDGSGYATVIVTPTAKVPVNVKHLEMFVRARKPGDSVLAGVSSRRLVRTSLLEA